MNACLRNGRIHQCFFLVRTSGLVPGCSTGIDLTTCYLPMILEKKKKNASHETPIFLPE